MHIAPRRSRRARMVWVVRFEMTVTGWPLPSSTIGTGATTGRPSMSTVARLAVEATATTLRARSARLGSNMTSRLSTGCAGGLSPDHGGERQRRTPRRVGTVRPWTMSTDPARACGMRSRGRIERNRGRGRDRRGRGDDEDAQLLTRTPTPVAASLSCRSVASTCCTAPNDPSLSPTSWGAFPMVPYAGRISNGRFDFAGSSYRMPINHGQHAIHGTTLTSRWIELAPGHLAVDLDKPWPFGGTVSHRVELQQDSDHTGRLFLELSILAGHDPMPAMVGWHPWFNRKLTGTGPAVELGFVDFDDDGDVRTRRRRDPDRRIVSATPARSVGSPVPCGATADHARAGPVSSTCHFDRRAIIG